MKRVVVVDYDPAWPQTFEQLKSIVLSVLDNVAAAVEHVGSTAVPGLAAKPVIDMDVVVERTEDVATAIKLLATIGYVHRGNLGIPDRDAFYRPPDLPPHHLYVCPRHSSALANHLAVRNYLRAHPDVAAEYGGLKGRLVREYPEDVDAYIRGKTELLLGILSASGL